MKHNLPRVDDALALHRLRQFRRVGYRRPSPLLEAILYDLEALYARHTTSHM